MTLEGGQLLTRCPVPDLHRAVKAPRGQAPVVRVERYTRHLTGMALEGQQFGIAQAGQVVPLKPAQISAGDLRGDLLEQLASQDEIVVMPGTLGHSHSDRIRAETSFVALFVRLNALLVSVILCLLG